MCILYDFDSRYSKKRLMPYHCLFQLPFQCGEPLMTQSRCASLSCDHAASRGMPASAAYFSRSSCESFQAGVWMVLIAPERSVLRWSGITNPQPTPITRPKPRQVSQAPIAELNENSAGCGSL